MIMKLADWARHYGVHPKTAYRWYREGTLPYPAEKIGTRTIIVRVPDSVEVGGAVIYARVSSHDQKEDLERQVARLMEYAVVNRVQVVRVEREIASGLNENRPKLNSLLRDASVTNIIVEHKDRLGRHNVQPLVSALAANGRTVTVVNEDEVSDDLVLDVLAVLTSYAAKLHGQKSAKHRAERAVKTLESKEDDPHV